MKRNIIMVVMAVVLLAIGGMCPGQHLGNQWASLAPDASIVRYDNAMVVQPSDDLIAKYDELKSPDLDPKMGPLTYNNRRVLRLAPGYYDLGANTWNVDTNYVDVVSMGGAVVQRTSGTDVNTIYQTSMDARFIGFKVISSASGSDSYGLVVENEVRGIAATTSGSTLTKAASGIGDLELGYKDDKYWPERLYDQVYMWDTNGGVTPGWYEIESGTGDTLTLASAPGNSAGDVNYVIISQRSRYIGMEFAGVKSSTSLGTGSGLWLNCIGGRHCFKTENPTGYDNTEILTGAATPEGTGGVGVPLIGHGLPPGCHVRIGSTTNYDENYAIQDISNADKIILDIRDGVFDAETFESPDTAYIYIAEHRAVVVNCFADEYSYVGDHAKCGSGLYVNNGGTDKCFSGCDGWASPLSSEAEFWNCRAGDLSFGLGADVDASFYNCVGRDNCFGGYLSGYYGRMNGYMQGCRANSRSCGAGYAGGAHLGAMNGTMVDCEITNSDSPINVEPGGVIRNSRIVVTGFHADCIKLSDRWGNFGTATFYNCDLIVNQGENGIAINAPTAIDARVTHCRMNNASENLGGLGANVTNLANQKDMRVVYNAAAVSTTITNTTDETTFDNTSFTVDGATLRDGDLIEIDGIVWVEDDNVTNTLTLRLYAAGQVLWTGGPKDVGAGDIANVTAKITVNTAGASGKLAGFGMESLTGAVFHYPWILQEVDEDISGAVEIKLTGQWSFAHVDNKCECNSFGVKISAAGFNVVDDDIN